MIDIEEYLKENNIPANSPLADSFREGAKYLEGLYPKLKDIYKHSN